MITTELIVETVWTGLLLSLKETVKFEVPLADGVPEISPEDDSVNPAGRPPEAIDQW